MGGGGGERSLRQQTKWRMEDLLAMHGLHDGMEHAAALKRAAHGCMQARADRVPWAGMC